jgi:hypothetical protein
MSILLRQPRRPCDGGESEHQQERNIQVLLPTRPGLLETQTEPTTRYYFTLQEWYVSAAIHLNIFRIPSRFEICLALSQELEDQSRVDESRKIMGCS